jgi:hypothetical protein
MDAGSEHEQDAAGGSDGDHFDDSAKHRAAARESRDSDDDDEQGASCAGPPGCCLALLPATGGHLGVARYDEEDCVFELLQLPHDQDGSGLKLICEQVVFSFWKECLFECLSWRCLL